MIKFYRKIIVVFCFSLFGLGALFIRYCIFPLQKTKIKNYETLQKSWKFFIWLASTLKMITLDIEESDRLKNIKNSIIVSTHPSFIDIVILMSIIPHSTCFVADKLALNPFLKGMVKLLFILEGQPLETWLNDASQKMDNGLNVIIFPMGKRHREDEYPRIRRGAAQLAQKSCKKISLIEMKTNRDFLQINQSIFDIDENPVKYTIKYLGEINTEEYINNYTDEVECKTAITRQIAKFLYYEK